VDRSAAFYGALFNWRSAEARPSSHGGGHLYRHVENTSVPFGFHDEMSDASPHLYFRVADLQAAVDRVRELGGEVLEVEQHESGGTARCRDDQGVAFELWQAAPGY
jgi:predicted enzyme related to lactoylglutathione lyase